MAHVSSSSAKTTPLEGPAAHLIKQPDDLCSTPRHSERLVLTLFSSNIITCKSSEFHYAKRNITAELSREICECTLVELRAAGSISWKRCWSMRQRILQQP